MPDAGSTHPTADQLARFALGKLPSDQLARVHEHLKACADCRRAVAPPDPPAGQSQSAGATTPYLPARPTEPGLAELPPELARSGKFEVLGKLGQGGMGAVYKARHVFLNEAVAIKVMNADLGANADARARFLREMQATAKLKHPNIVRALDAEALGDHLILVMEYVEGITLDRLVKQKGPLPVAHACRFLSQAAQGLQHAHEQGMVHRDIKPANLMVTAKGKEVKVLDFGLARGPRDQQGTTNLTRYQTFMGTPEYAAPEQVADAATADIRADVYSLGCTLFFLLTGRPPFQGASVMNVLLAHIQDEPPALDAVRPDVPAGLAAVVAKMLAKSPGDRHQTPGEVAKALLPFVTAAKAVVPPRLPAGRLPDTVLADDLTFDAAVAPFPRRPAKPAWRAWPLVVGSVVASVVMLAVVGVVVAPPAKVEGKRGSETNPPKANPPEVKTPKPAEPVIINSVGIKLVRIPAGKFKMGSPADEEGRRDDEQQHEVEITRPFYLGAYEVTQEQYEKVMGTNPSHFSASGGGSEVVRGMDTRQFPVERVSWEAAVEFCRRLTERERTEGKLGREGAYRLPTEAEWEYACRGGASTSRPYHFGTALAPEQANFGDHVKRPTNVGSYPPNAFGLYDMHGNVWEWCSDWYAADYVKSDMKDPRGPQLGDSLVLRSGAWGNEAQVCRAACRSRGAPSACHFFIGLRVLARLD